MSEITIYSKKEVDIEIGKQFYPEYEWKLNNFIDINFDTPRNFFIVYCLDDLKELVENIPTIQNVSIIDVQFKEINDISDLITSEGIDNFKSNYMFPRRKGQSKVMKNQFRPVEQLDPDNGSTVDIFINEYDLCLNIHVHTWKVKKYLEDGIGLLNQRKYRWAKDPKVVSPEMEHHFYKQYFNYLQSKLNIFIPGEYLTFDKYLKQYNLLPSVDFSSLPSIEELVEIEMKKH